MACASLCRAAAQLHGRVRGNGSSGVHHRGRLLLLTGHRQKSLVVQCRFCACGRRGGGLPGAEARKVEGVRKHDLHASRPVGAVKAKTSKSAIELSIRIRAAVAREHTGLKVHMRQVRPRQDVLLCLSDIDSGLAKLCERVCRRRRRRNVGRKVIDKSRGINRHRATRHTQHARQRNLRQRDSLLRLDQTCLCRGALRITARRFRARAQLIVDKSVNGSREEIATIDIGLERRHGTLSADDIQEGSANGGLNVEPGQRFGGACTSHRGLGADDGSLTKAEVERFPGEQRARSTAPNAATGSRRKHRAGHRRDHGLRQHLAEDVVRGAAIRLPE